VFTSTLPLAALQLLAPALRRHIQGEGDTRLLAARTQELMEASPLAAGPMAFAASQSPDRAAPEDEAVRVSESVTAAGSSAFPDDVPTPGMIERPSAMETDVPSASGRTEVPTPGDKPAGPEPQGVSPADADAKAGAPEVGVHDVTPKVVEPQNQVDSKAFGSNGTRTSSKPETSAPDARRPEGGEIPSFMPRGKPASKPGGNPDSPGFMPQGKPAPKPAPARTTQRSI
jgi:hypothetical protein